MALIRKCDRCQAIYDDYGHPTNIVMGITFQPNSVLLGFVEKTSYDASETYEYDLCPKCLEGLQHYLFSKPTNLNEGE